MSINLSFLVYSFIVLIIYFALGWYVSFYKKVFSLIDFVWSTSFIFVVAIFHMVKFKSHGDTSFRLIDLLYLIWSLRLSLHLYKRIKKNGEDRRYIELKKKWKIWYGLNFFVLFQVEALLTIFLSIPLALSYDDTPSLFKYLSVVVFMIAIVGETLSDKQLASFIHLNKDSSKVCNTGLWKYSRHPNYFFEWLIWISFALYGLSSSEKWPAILPCLVMYLLLTKVTGIPPAEESSLKSKKENYKNYQLKTNSFFPWFSKKLIISLLFIISFNSTNSLTYGANMQQQEKIKYTFDNLRSDNIQILDDFYAKDTQFIDPIGTHEGLDSVKSYYKNLYKNVNAISFTYKDIVSSGNTHVLVWTMALSANGLNNGQPILLEGNSYIKFNDNNLVIYHRDYFDMGEFIYEHIPLLGWTVKKIKNKLRGH